MVEPLSQAFYARSPIEVAADLLGAELTHETSEGVASGIIVEAEAYLMDDPACHAHRGETERTRVMFGEAGRAYVYLSYGCHWLFNVVSGEEGVGCGVLIRAVEPAEGIDLMRARRPNVKRDVDLTAGPGRLSDALGITNEQYGARLWDGSLTIRRTMSARRPMTVTTRVGISQARDLPLRFYVTNSRYISKRSRYRSRR